MPEEQLGEFARRLLDADHLRRPVIADLLAPWVRAMGARQILAWDRSGRSSLPVCNTQQFADLVQSLKTDSGWCVAAIFSSHRDGYVRESALDHLDGFGSDADIPFLMLRLNDWVPAIRIKARALLLGRIEQVSPSFLFGLTALIKRMRSWSRAHHARVLAEIDRVLSRPEAAEARFEALRRIARMNILGHLERGWGPDR